MSIERDWTPSDAADAADDERDRQWWRKPSPYLDYDYRANPDPSDEEEA